MRFSRLRTISTAFINLALVFLIAGLGIVFAVIWGPNIKYTHTYYHLSQSASAYAKPLASGDLYAVILAIVAQLVFVAIRGRRFFVRWGKVSSLLSIVAAVVVASFGLFLFVEIEATGEGISSLWLDPKDNLVVSGHIIQPGTANYYIFLDKTGPRRLHTGQSAQVEIVFKMLDHDAPGAYPIALDPNHSYAVSIFPTSNAFEIASVGTEGVTQVPIELNTPIRSAFILSPKSGYEGEQVVVFKAVIYDLDNNASPVQNSPYASIELEIGTPFGLPGWLVSSETGLGAIIGSTIAIVVTWFFNEISDKRKARREEEARRKEEVVKLWKPK